MLITESSLEQKILESRQRYAQTLQTNPTDIMTFCQLGRFFWETGQQEDFEKCLEHAVKILKAGIKANSLEWVLAIEMRIVKMLVTTTETEEHYARCFAMWKDDMAAYGRTYRLPDADKTTVAPGRIAFVVQVGIMLGHTQVMFNHLENLHAANLPGIVPRIYVLDDLHADFRTRAEKIGIEVWTPDPSIKEFGKRILATRDRMQADGYGIAIWVCVPVTMTFAFSARLAPVQILWSMKFHPIAGDFIDGYITYGAWDETQRIYGKQAWEICPEMLALDYPLPSQEAISRFRAPYGDAFILGALAREEKIAHPDYLDAVCTILEQNPNCVLLWCGKTPLATIVDYFRQRGVESRCHFIGWVDTALVTACLDLFLETFPFGFGIIPFQAMKARTPLLSYASELTSFGVDFWKKYKDGWDIAQSPILAAKTKEEYVALAGRLIRDPVFRQKTVAAESKYFGQEMANKGKYVERLFSIIRTITNRTLHDQA